MTDWFTHMRRGDFAEAWAVSDSILAERGGLPCWHLPRHEQWVWNGAPLANQRVLIRCYHGLGDTIQFARYFPLVNAIARESIVWAQPALLPILSTMHGVGRLLPLHDGDAEVAYDVDVESMELAHVFRSTIDTLPNRVPYLHVDPAPIEKRRFTAGVVWRAGEWDPNRSIDFSVELPGVDVVSLDKEHAGDVLSTARLMRAVDVVVTVDTMSAHLAGALGVPVFTLLPYECDWRWMDGRDDSPWYPTMRLFRQRKPGGWHEVLGRVRYAIRAMADEQNEKKTVSDSLNDWGIDVDRFKERAKESLQNAKGDLTEITGTLRQTLVQAKDVVMGLQTNGAPAAAELKAGFERAWQEIERAFKAAREKAKGEGAAEPPADPPAPPEPPEPPASS